MQSPKYHVYGVVDHHNNKIQQLLFTHFHFINFVDHIVYIDLSGPYGDSITIGGSDS